LANPLTGDFEAVLQVSGATVNRLLASMHQNAGANPDTPSFPHVMSMRIGDPDPIDGMRGFISGQISVPRIDLIHGVSDRFSLEVSIRARYMADPGSITIPGFIHGVVRAQYLIDMVDPACWGWEKIASDFLWVRVIDDTVSFTGTAVDDVSIVSATQTSIDPSTADVRITQIVRHLLATRFQATPHKVSRRFRRGAMRSLNTGANNSLVAIPIGLWGDPSAGKIDSINQNILDGRDVAIGVNRNVIISKIQEQLDAIRQSFRMIFRSRNRGDLNLGFADVKVGEVNIDWAITLSSATAQWMGGLPPLLGIPLSGGLVNVTIHGQARTQKSIFNFDFDVTQTMLITFDGSTEEFAAAPFGAATVSVPGILGPVVEALARTEIQNGIAGAMKNAAAGMAGQISVSTRKDDLVKQLQTMDAVAGVFFTNAVFTTDGVVIRGDVTVSPRKAPEVSFGFTATKNGYSAFQSWIPGGTVDSFNWSWKWFNNGGKPGFTTISDRYLLRRPAAKGKGKFGIVLGVNQPLPGLDGMGQVCLVVSGTRTHPVTGEVVPITVSRKCKRFGLDLSLPAPDRLFLREWVPGPRDPIGPVAEVAIHEVNSTAPSGGGANTLIVRAGNAWNRDVAMSLRDGLQDCSRRDAGLVVLVLFNDRRLMEAQPEMLEELRALAAELEAPLVVNEDVEGSWSNALRIQDRDGVEWRLVTPTGGVTWAHSGHIGARELARALDDYLFRSPAPALSHIMDGPLAGARVPGYALESDVVGRLSRLDDGCPPPPFERLGLETAVKFIKKNSLSSEAALRAMTAESDRSESNMYRVIVLDCGTREDEERMRELIPNAMIVADTHGTIARRFGVSSWPSAVTISERGTIVEPEATDHE
jgi:hypothetical protein